MKVNQMLKDRANKFKDKPAIIFKERSICFQELNDTVNQLSSGFLNQGINKGDKVAVFMPNSPEYIFAYLALFSIGAVIVPLDFMFTQQEILQFIDHSDASTLIILEKKGIDLAAVAEACTKLKKMILMQPAQEAYALGEDFILWQNLMKENRVQKEINVEDSDPCAIFYTSGSTWHPKGVLLSYGHLDNPVRCIDHFLKVKAEDSYLCAGVPFSHVGGLDYILFMLAFGSTLVLMERFNPIETLKNLQQYKISIICIVPAMYVAILSMKESDKFDLSALKYAAVFGAPSSPALLKRFNQFCPNATLVNGWGMTETAAPNTFSPLDSDKIASIGPFGVGMEARVVDQAGEDVDQDQRGELWIKGDAVMEGYYKEEELTKNAFAGDGWFKTGDIVTKDEDGLYYIVGRIKDMIKVAGEIVFASEVEEVLSRHAAIQEAAVIGAPDKLRGEVVKAFVVLSDPKIDVNDIKSYAKENLAHFKVPQSFEIKEALPKNRTGKIDKESLKSEI